GRPGCGRSRRRRIRSPGRDPPGPAWRGRREALSPACDAPAAARPSSRPSSLDTSRSPPSRAATNSMCLPAGSRRVTRVRSEFQPQKTAHGGAGSSGPVLRAALVRALSAILLLLGASVAPAADQLLSGERLVLSKHRLGVVSRDAGMTLGLSPGLGESASG